jgi:DNA-binding NtrC family response regulator
MATVSPPPGTRPVILLVDDEPELLQTMRLGLGNEFELDCATSAEEAELMLGTREYDAIVSDHLMPGEEGLQFLIRAGKRHPKTRRILITGYMNPELISRSVALAGLSACLLKPIPSDQLANSIRQALR